MQIIRNYVVILFIALSIFTAPLTQAQLIENLYRTELIVSDRLTRPDEASLRLGLKRVLVKVSGTALATHIVDEVVTEPKRYLREFQFESTFQVRTDKQGNDYLAQRLLLIFDRAGIVQLLQANKMVPLGKYRPRLLVWLLGDEDAELVRLRNDLEDYAQRVQFPMQLLVAKELGLNKREQSGKPLFEKIRTRSLAYGTALIIVVFSDPVKGLGWSVIDKSALNKIKWKFLEGALSEQISLTFTAWIEASGIKIDDANNFNVNSHQITVTRVKNLADYAAIMEYIRALPSIESIQVTSMNNQTLTLSFQSQLDSSALSRLLSLDRRMLLMRPLEVEVADSLRWGWFGTRGR